MTDNQLIILILLSFGLLITSIIVTLMLTIIELKEKSDKYYVFIILSGMVITFLLPVLLGMIQEIL